MAFVPNPPVPYIGPLNGVATGMMIQIAGQTPSHAKWFAVNLQCGYNVNPRDDIALHINPRFEGNMSKIVRNDLQMQRWGLEENFGHFPFVAGQPFELLILVDNDVFKIAINGQHYTEFRHRLPMQRINTLAVDGDVQLFSIRIEYPGPPRAPSPLPSVQSGQFPAGYAAGVGMPIPQLGQQQPFMYNPAGATTQPTYAPQFPQSSQYGYTQQQQPYSAQQNYPAAGSAGLHSSSAPMPVPGHSPTPGYKQGLAGAAVGLVTGAAAAYGANKLMYPGHGGGMMGMGQGGGMMGAMGPAGMLGMGMHHKKMKKLYKHKFHKPKFHKGFKMHKPKFHKGWHHKGWGSGSSSSSEESEESE